MRLTSRLALSFAISCLATRVAAQPDDTLPAAPVVSAEPNDPSSRAEEIPPPQPREAAPEASTDVSPDVTPAAVDDGAAEMPPPVEEAPVDAGAGFRGFLQDNVAIHGFGTYQAGYTHVRSGWSNDYQFGDGNGEFAHVNFSLRELVQPIPELRLFAGQSFNYVDGALAVELDLAGAQWTPAPWFSFRVGRILSPIGIYTEIYRVGTLRPFGSLPTSIYGRAGFIAQSYDGGELAFTIDGNAGWSTRFSAFAGYSNIPQDNALGYVIEGMSLGALPLGSVKANLELQLMFGGNVRVDTPIEGLGFAFGAMGSQAKYTQIVANNPLFDLHQNNLELIGSAYYLRDKVELRAEFAYRRNHDSNTGRTIAASYGLYVEAAYRPLERMQVAARYERYDTTQLDAQLGSYASTKSHDDIGGVLSYWFTRDFVVKLEYHFINGNRFAHPLEDKLYYAAAAGARLAPHTHFIGFTSSFSF